MRYTGPFGYILTGSAILAVFAGCSGGGSSSSPVALSPAGTQPQSGTRSPSSIGEPIAGPGFAAPDAALKAVLIEADARGISIYTLEGKLIGQITGLSAQGVAAGPLNALYFWNTNTSNVKVYKDDYKTLLTTLNDPGQSLSDVAVDATTRLVGVTNIIDTSGGPGSVSFYKAGATSPCVTVKSRAFGRVYFGAFDDAGNFYVDGQGPNGNTVIGVVKGGCAANTITPLTTSNAISFPGGIAVTPNDTIAIDDQTGSVIYTYNAPQNNSLGSPIATTSLKGALDPVTLGFTTSGTDLWMIDAGSGAALEYNYPGGGTPIQTLPGFGHGQPIAVIARPPAQP